VKLYVSPEAEGDLDEIEEYIGADNPLAATNFVKHLAEYFLQLTDNPGIGRKRDYLRTGLRSITKGDYLILYCQKNDVVEVVRVLHGARDIEAIFQSFER
jgi:toxin ParE1/3/4